MAKVTHEAASSVRRVLIVDDEKDWRDDLSARFRNEGAVAVVAKNADQALKLLGKGGFSEIVVDGLGGRWREIAEASQGIPVKLVTSDELYQQEAQSMGYKFVDKTDHNGLKGIAINP